VALGGFLTGSAIAALVLTRDMAQRHATADLRAGVALEFAVLSLFCAIWVGFRGANAHSVAVLFLLASGGCGLGIQSVAVRRLKISGVVTTFITGTMTIAVVELISGDQSAKDAGDSSPLLLAAMFFTYVLAAALGASAHDTVYPFACFVPLAGAALVLLRQLHAP
jgi:uncharacterized membrane protein YoaK (UPF0700 family)